MFSPWSILTTSPIFSYWWLPKWGYDPSFWVSSIYIQLQLIYKTDSSSSICTKMKFYRFLNCFLSRIFSILENCTAIYLRKNLEITVDPSFSLMFGIFLQCTGPGRHSSHHIGIASVYIFPNAMVTSAAANSVSGIYIAITACLMPQQCLPTPSAPILPMCHPLYVP